MGIIYGRGGLIRGRRNIVDSILNLSPTNYYKSGDYLLNGSTVSQWNNLVSSNHLTQSTASLQPQKVTVGGRDWLRFDGVDDFLTATFSLFSNQTTGSIFIKVSFSNLNGIKMLVSERESATAGTASLVYSNITSLSGQSSTVLSGGSLSINTPLVAGWRFQNGQRVLTINNTLVATDSNNTPALTYLPMRVGRHYSTTSAEFQGDIGGIVHFNRFVNDTELSTIVSNL